MPDDLPRRRRRSSISEHIQRVFINVDRSDKKARSSDLSDTNSQDQPNVTKTQLGNESNWDLGTPTGTSVENGWGSNSVAYSSLHSRNPSVHTPDSSLSVQPLVVKYEDTVPQTKPRMTPEGNVSHAIDEICSSPTWHRDERRKERRATKRLEAERKELEKRLLQLEEAQAKLDHGVYERDSRRLTKKQPRSSSTHSGRQRSPSAFSVFFSSRRRSRSRASSVDGGDRQSDNPPTLPLELPEQFGASVSRELATRHGTSLDTSHQPPAALHTLPRLHTMTKSDDLRESWKMAEAWKEKNDIQDTDSNLTSTVNDQPFPVKKYWGDGSRLRPRSLEPSTNHDRKLFTANLRHERRVSDVPVSALNTYGGPVPQLTLTSPQDSGLQSEGQPLVQGSAPTHITENCQPRRLISTSSNGPQGLYDSNGSKSNTSPSAVSTGSPPREIPTASSSNTVPVICKHSPLSSNPTTTLVSGQRNETRALRHPAILCPGSSQNPNLQQPASQLCQHEDNRGRSRQPVSTSLLSEIAHSRSNEAIPNDRRRSFHGSTDFLAKQSIQQEENHNPRISLYDDKQNNVAREKWQSSSVIPPLKHPDRMSPPADHVPDWQMNGENQHAPTTTKERAGDHLSEESEHPRNSTLFDTPAITIPTNERTRPVHSRSPSRNSSHEASSYDTADEEVLDTPYARPHGARTEGLEANEQESPIPVTKTPARSTRAEDSAECDNINLPPPLARGGAVSRKKPGQKTKGPKQDEVLAKLFVICCHCRYWHDMPSEVYARLACPERLPPESFLVRTFSGRRRSSFLSNGSRRLSVPESTYSSNETQNAGDVRGLRTTSERPTLTSSSQPPPLYRPQCCWCGHHMSKSCCQGWTTIVQMRERHH